jgi:hypothetical protein
MEYIACYRKSLTYWECQNGFNDFEEASEKILKVAKTKNCPTSIVSVFKYLPTIVKERYIAYKLTPFVKISFGPNNDIY